MKRTAFTLIELLVVIAIIAILAAILFPVFAQAKTAAKRSADLSNVKQITLAGIQYMGDSDDVTPLYQQTPAGKLENTPGMLSWKDSVSPYIKSGGQPYNNGQLYKQNGNGGVFQSPMADAPWSSISPTPNGVDDGGWPGGNYPTMNGGTGDSTTRFPRSYALNMAAGITEGGALGKGIVGKTIEAANGTVAVSGSPGSPLALADPANILFVIPIRVYLLAILGPELHGTCTAEGYPWQTDFSCVPSTKNRNLTASFFDGHAKNVNGPSTFAKDMWGYETYFDNRFGSPPGTSGASDAAAAMKIKEWRG